MSEIAALVSDHLDIWTAATDRKNGAGRGGGKRVSFYGIERLRALIFDLALRGRLVSQIASDEPASDLMKRVGQDRAALGGKVPKAEAVTPPPDLPAGWITVTLADLANPQAGFAFKSVGFNELGVGLPLIRIRDVGQPFTGTFYSGDYRDEFVVQEGDYLVSMDGEFRVATWDGPNALLNQRVSRLQFYAEEVVRPFVAMALQTELTQLQGVKAYTTVDHLSGKQIAGSVIRLPPLAEQGRIVAKVDELMALCDALEGQSAAALAAHHTLVGTLLASLVNSADAADLAANWSRLEVHFSTLFTTEASVDALKQTVLELAVRGQLVRQDENDSPAVDLIANWQRAKQEKLEQGGDRRVKQAETPTKPPFPLPSHWAIQSFENVFLFIDYRGNTPPKTDDGIPLITAKNIRMGYLDREPREFVSLATYKSWMTRGFPKTGDLFFTTEAPLGNICLNDIDEPFAIAQRAICLQPYGEANTRFLAIAIMSRSMQRVIDEAATGMTARGIKAGRLKTIALPIPPAAEQERIVAKVDELLSLCEDLKAQIGGAGQTQMRLADAIVERAAA